MKALKFIIIALLISASVSSCEYFYSLDLENNYSGGIYVWSSETGLKTGDDPASVDDLNSKLYLHYVKPGEMGSFADVMTGKKVDAQWVVDDVFWKTDVLMIAIFDAKSLDENWGHGKMSIYGEPLAHSARKQGYVVLGPRLDVSRKKNSSAPVRSHGGCRRAVSLIESDANAARKSLRVTVATEDQFIAVKVTYQLYISGHIFKSNSVPFPTLRNPY